MSTTPRTGTSAGEIRVLHLLGSLGEGGRESLLLDIVDNSPAGISHEICCFQVDADAAAQFERRGVGVSSVDADSKFDLPGLARCYRHLFSASVDVLHLHGPRAQVPGRVLGRAAGIRTVVSTHHGVREMHPEGILRLERLTRPLETETIAVSEGVRHSFVDEDGGDQWQTVQNGIDVAAFSRAVSDADGASLRSKHGLEPDDLVYLNVGRYVDPKRQQDLIPAMDVVGESTSGAHLFVVGGRGGGEPLLRQAVSDGDQADAITVTGRVDDIHEYYAMADVFVSSSVQEGLPIVLLEAMAAELPVVATSIPGVRELVVDGESGLLVPPKSPERLGEAMVRMTDAETRTAFAERGHERVRESFDIRATVEGYLSIYRRLTNGRAVGDGDAV